jgi:CubicO group peptidase (beta-lactamase class C family)
MRKLLLALLLTGLLAAQPLPVSTPEREGFSTERLERLHNTFDKFVKDGRKAGAITLLVRNGRIADWKTYGYRDLESKLPMEKDTICRIWSMTKPITSVAVMMLVEEGKIALDDRVEKFIPEFKGLMVFKGGTAANPILEAPERPMTVKHLLTHTAGMVYGWENDVLAEIYGRAKIFEGPTLKEFVNRMAKLPLASTPGEKYKYSVAIDVLGYIVEVASGTPFDRFVQARIVSPLKMNDTAFVVPESKKARIAKTYMLREGKLAAAETIGDMKIAPGVPFGGMGLYSTIGDYARFAQMLLNGGELEGQRLLGRKTVELMMKNHLNNLALPTIGGNDSDGFGLGGSVRIDAAKAGRPGTEGLFGWDGAASTYFRVDPKEKLAALLFMQWMPYDAATLNLFETLYYQALVEEPVAVPASRVR